MNVADWQYAGEGGKHALFSYRPTAGQVHTPWLGKLLRLVKKDLALALSVVLAADAPNTGTNELTDPPAPKNPPPRHHQESESLQFMRHFVKPQLEQYLDLPESIILSWSFLNELREATVNSRPCPIPVSRLTSWIGIPLSSPHEKSIENDSTVSKVPVGMLIWDYRSFSRERSLQTSASPIYPCLSIEIKPKAGYLAVSPLVDPEHRVKYFQSRFVLLQELDREGYADQVQRGWKSGSVLGPENTDQQSITAPTNISSYDPMDLFSVNCNRIKGALESLWTCPQNNFKLWYTPVVSSRANACPLVYKDSILLRADGQYFVTPPNNEHHQQALRSFFSSFASTQDMPDGDDVMKGGAPKEILMNLLTAVLWSERTLMDKLRQFQQLDVLDADGAVLVYQRLVDLCEGSHKEAQRKLDQYSCSPVICNHQKIEESARGSALGKALQWSPLEFPKESACCPAFVALCQELDRFAGVVGEAQKSGEFSSNAHNSQGLDKVLSEEHQASRLFSIQQTSSIKSKEACVYLLQNWLLSSIFCDVSFFVTIQELPMGTLHEVPPPDPSVDNPTKYCPVTNISTMVHQQQAQDKPGIILLQLHQKQSLEEARESGGEGEIIQTIPIQYEMKVIDCDRKPSTKLEARHKKEKIFTFLNARVSSHRNK